MSRINLAILVATLVGLAVAIWTFGWAGIGTVATIARQIGVGGFLLYCLWSSGVFVILGAAWAAATPGRPTARVARFAWARAVREAVADLLPLSQIGGIVVGARTLTSAGLPTARIYASLIVDMTTELAAQALFTAFGITAAVLLLPGAAAGSTRAILVGAGAALVVLIGVVLAGQYLLPRVAGSLVGRMLPGSVATLATLQVELVTIYTHRRHVAFAFLLNLLAWVASAAGAWIVLHLIGASFALSRVLALESLIFMLRSVAFAVPGGLGVQEAGYALLAPLLGIPVEMALALALAKRARDVAIGLPTIVLWQLGEVRNLARAQSRGS
jgi:putative membrane protein